MVISWVPTRLIKGDFASALRRDGFNECCLHDRGVYMKEWEEPLNDLCGAHPDECVVFCGRHLQEASGHHANVDRQYFSFDQSEDCC